MRLIHDQRNFLAMSGITLMLASLSTTVVVPTDARAQWTQFGGPGQAFTA